SNRYITDRFLPDKAIDLIDEAGSRVRLRSYTIPSNLKELEEDLEKVRNEKATANLIKELEKAASYRDKEQKLKEKVEETKDKWKEKQGKENLAVTEEDIATVVSSWTGVPVVKLTKDESDRLLNMEDTLHDRLIGQEEA